MFLEDAPKPDSARRMVLNSHDSQPERKGYFTWVTAGPLIYLLGIVYNVKKRIISLLRNLKLS